MPPVALTNTYLGSKGYTLSKNQLTPEQQRQLIADLTITPFTPGAPCGGAKSSFFAYRESANKFYVPHHYGVEKFGPPSAYKLSEGMDINLTFNGAPRDYQIDVIQKYLDHCKAVGVGGGLLELHTGWGKTCAGLYILSKLKKKTLIIVHKEFLMNQWVERIRHFLPDAKIGKIQGPIIDVEGKDIVICMLQSLMSKDYPASLFAQFGFTIVDEVHHISSQSFSNSLFKVVTKYMLGLSATMNRKDGTTNVFKMFLGDVIHKAERKTDTLVEVRALTFKTNDAEFNETELDFRGKPQNSKMISKLCEFSRRTEFILQALCDFIRVGDPEEAKQHKADMDRANPPCAMCHQSNHYLMENTCCGCVKYCMHCLDELASVSKRKTQVKCPDCNKALKYEQHYVENPYVQPIHQRHTIVMAHNLNVLHYLYRKIVCNNLASVGYYVGGMKEAELKKSETKQIILSTYVMVSEGLDIPSLNAEFLITPKTDVVQAVGRILRAKHAHHHPVIYDFVDSHDVFQRQWYKRRAYYKKQNYKIVGIQSTQYHPRAEEWKVLHSPSVVPDRDAVPSDESDAENSVEEKEDDATEVCLLSMPKT